MQVISNQKQQHVIITMDNEEVKELRSDLLASVRWFASAEDGSAYPKDKYSIYRIMQLLETLDKEE